MNLLLILLLIILFILIIQFDLKGKVSFNFNTNTGTIVIKLLNFRIINYIFSFKKGYIEIVTKRTQHLIPFEFNKESFEEVNKIQEFIFSKIYFKKVNVFINIGLKEKAYETALLTGLINVILTNLLIALKNAKTEVLESVKVYNDFEKSVLKFTLKFKISISLFDLLWCFVENLVYKQINKHTISKNEQTR